LKLQHTDKVFQKLLMLKTFALTHGQSSSKIDVKEHRTRTSRHLEPPNASALRHGEIGIAAGLHGSIPVAEVEFLAASACLLDASTVRVGSAVRLSLFKRINGSFRASAQKAQFIRAWKREHRGLKSRPSGWTRTSLASDPAGGGSFIVLGISHHHDHFVRVGMMYTAFVRVGMMYTACVSITF